MKKQLIRAAATTVLGLSLTTGFAAAATGSINQTGADSNNKISSKVYSSSKTSNKNKVGVANVNLQGSFSGDAKSAKNTTAGDTSTGDASNSICTSADISVSNSGASSANTVVSDPTGSASISNTGADSNNYVTSKVVSKTSVTNKNDVKVVNFNGQLATSGDASSYKNTTAGDTTTGSASNTNSSTFTVNVSN